MQLGNSIFDIHCACFTRTKVWYFNHLISVLTACCLLAPPSTHGRKHALHWQSCNITSLMVQLLYKPGHSCSQVITSFRSYLCRLEEPSSSLLSSLLVSPLRHFLLLSIRCLMSSINGTLGLDCGDCGKYFKFGAQASSGQCCKCKKLEDAVDSVSRELFNVSPKLSQLYSALCSLIYNLYRNTGNV